MNRIILLVEDNPSDEALTREAFESCGVANEIVVVRDGAAALDYLFAGGSFAARDVTALPRLILLDLKLPKIDGIEVLKRLRADPRTELLPVVVLTSSHEDEDIIRSLACGANAYVRKPVEFEEFAAAAKTLGLFWLLMNQPAPARKRAP
jgi:two-component system response regulator